MARAGRPGLLPLLAALALASCGEQADDGADPKVTTLGTIEVTAQLTEIVFYKDGKLPANDLYDYVYILRYRVLEAHRGKVEADVIYVGQYNPLKPRAEAADVRAEGIGGNLTRFRVSDVHRMALEVPLDDYYMGPIINKYHGKATGPLYWAVWTNRVVR